MCIEKICYTMGRLDVFASYRHCKMARFSIFGGNCKACMVLYGTDWMSEMYSELKWHISPVLAAISGHLTFSSFCFRKVMTIIFHQAPGTSDS